MVKAIRKEVDVTATLDEVWDAWTTEDGITSFFSRKANISLEIGGPYEMLFLLDNPVGQQGGEGNHILSFLPKEMLSFEWNAPPNFPEVRKHKTWVVLQFESLDTKLVKVKLTHLGWREGRNWGKVFEYFGGAWESVLSSLKEKFQ
ncbi:MAG: SRPBCC family protein [Candidatus Thorarchaeota archaeon]|jgi:uncharacterized protein YndB with AHSA1/START domain